MTVSSLQRTTAEHVTVRLGDGSEIKSTLGAVTELRLFAGKDLDGEQLDELRLLSRRLLALEKASGYLSYRPLSGRELKDKLLRRGMDEETADYCVEKLTDTGLMDDGSYAVSVAKRYASKGYGAGRIKAELARRGIDRELWDDALETTPPPDDRLDRLVRSKLKDPEDRDEIRKLSASLYRRGYSWDEIRDAIGRCADNTEFEDY